MVLFMGNLENNWFRINALPFNPLISFFFFTNLSHLGDCLKPEGMKL